MNRTLDAEEIENALKEAAVTATYGTREQRSGRFLPAKSSVIVSFQYDEAAAALDITFAGGKTYRYFTVPLEIYVDLLEANSKGQFFNDRIKNAFAFAEVRSTQRA